jgi:predicted dehydrogenase
MLGLSAGLLGSSVVAPSIIPAAVLGRNSVMAPSDRITMGFIGVGTQGGGHLLGGAWTYVTGGYTGCKDVQVAAVFDVWRDRREKARLRVNRHYADTYGKWNYRSCEAYVDFRSVLDRSDIDAVLITTPAHWHGTMAIMAAQAGKDIYCEKPTAVTVRESQAVLAAVPCAGLPGRHSAAQRIHRLVPPGLRICP